MLDFNIVSIHITGDQTTKSVRARRNNPNNPLHTVRLEFLIYPLSILGKIPLQSNIVQQSSAAWLFLGKIAELNPKSPQHLDSIFQWFCLGILAPTHHFSIDSGKIHTELLLETCDSHWQLSTHRTLVHAP